MTVVDDGLGELASELEACQQQRDKLVAEIERLKFENADIKNELASYQAQQGSGGKIHSGVSELRQAFYHHRQNSKLCQEQAGSAFLLLFYAVECGLKMIYLRRNGLQNTAALAKDGMLSKYGHNLRFWIEKLKLPRSVSSISINFTLRRGDETHGVERAHEVWRYGIRMEHSDEQKIIQWLQDISAWIEKDVR